VDKSEKYEIETKQAYFQRKAIKFKLDATEAMNRDKDTHLDELERKVQTLSVKFLERSTEDARGGGPPYQPSNEPVEFTEEHHVEFALRFADLTPEQFTEGKQRAYIETVASHVQQPMDTVEITKIEAGSVVVHARVVHAHEAHCDATMNAVGDGAALAGKLAASLGQVMRLELNPMSHLLRTCFYDTKDFIRAPKLNLSW
jgi:hypothetical protein